MNRPTTRIDRRAVLGAPGLARAQAPARTPRPVIERLGAEIDAIMREPSYIARIAELGGSPPAPTHQGGSTPAAFEAFIRAEITKWSEVVRVSGARVE